MCVLSTLCGNVDKHSPFDIYIYMYISMNTCVIVTNPYLHIIPLPGLSFYASALIGVLVSIEAVSRTWVEFLC